MSEPAVNLMSGAHPSGGVSPHGWYPPRLYRRYFQRQGGDWLSAMKRWRAELADELKRRVVIDGIERLDVRGDALYADGRTVARVANETPYEHIPSEVKQAGRSSRERDLLLREAWQRDRDLQVARPDLAPTTDRYFAELEQLHGAWAREHGVSLKAKAMMRLRACVAKGEPTDCRFKSGRRPMQYDPRLVDVVRETYLHPNRFSIAEADRRQQARAAELNIPALSGHQMRAIVGEYPAAARAAAREKQQVFEAHYVPKARIDYTAVPAGDWLCLDGRVADVRVRIPAASGGWKAVRPVILGILDQRSTKLYAELCRTENATAILRGLAAWIGQHGLPTDLTRDQGEAYKRLSACSPQPSASKDDAGLADVFSRFGVTVHGSLPYHAWAKKIESIWRLLANHCDRWYRAYWAGRPELRGDIAEELAKTDSRGKLLAHHVEELPTWDEFAASLSDALGSYNAAPRRGLGSLSPDAMFARFRGPIRRIDPEVLDTYFAIARGPHRVGRDGVVLDGILYRLPAHDLVRLQGQKVYILPALTCAGLVRLCDANERLLATATAEQLVAAGATDDDARQARAEAARVRRLAKAYLPQRDFLLTRPTGQILRQRAQRARAADGPAVAAQVAAVAPPPVTIVRPDLVAEVKRASKKSPFGRLAEIAGGAASSAGAERGTRRAAFAKLAEQTVDIPSPQKRRVDWSRYSDESATESAAPELAALRAARGDPQVAAVMVGLGETFGQWLADFKEAAMEALSTDPALQDAAACFQEDLAALRAATGQADGPEETPAGGDDFGALMERVRKGVGA